MQDDTPVEDHLSLEYRGPKVELGHMDAYRVAQQIIGFTDYLTVVAKTTYGFDADIRTDVQGFRGESFDIDFVFQVAGSVATMFSASAITPKDMINMIKHSFDAWKHLKGKPPKSVRADHNSSSVYIENNDGEIRNYHYNVFNIITDPKAGIAVEKFIKEPLGAGIDEVKIASKQYRESAEATKIEADSFTLVAAERPLLEDEVDTFLVVESPTFKEGNKWRFYDGSSSFYADMADKEFLAKVDDGSVRFGKGDVLKVTMKNIQKSTLDTIKLERQIMKVQEHRPSARQDVLFE